MNFIQKTKFPIRVNSNKFFFPPPPYDAQRDHTSGDWRRSQTIIPRQSERRPRRRNGASPCCLFETNCTPLSHHQQALERYRPQCHLQELLHCFYISLHTQLCDARAVNSGSGIDRSPRPTRPPTLPRRSSPRSPSVFSGPSTSRGGTFSRFAALESLRAARALSSPLHKHTRSH